MVVFVGAVFLLQGLLSGLIMLLTPLGVVGTGTPGPLVWLMFPALSIAGYLTFTGGNLRAGPRLAALVGGALLLLGLAALVALFLRSAGFVAAGAGGAALGYVAGIGLLLGGIVFSIRRSAAPAEPKE